MEIPIATALGQRRRKVGIDEKNIQVIIDIKKSPTYAEDFVAQKGLITNDLKRDLADMMGY